MMFRTHVLFGIISGYAACEFLECGNAVLFVSLSAVGSMLPDIDSARSKISRKLRPFSIIPNFLFSHRGFIHSVFPALLLYALLVRIDYLIAASLSTGFLSHLLMDSLTKRGIRPLYPLSKVKIAGFIRTNGFSERIILFLLVIVTVLITFQYLIPAGL